MELSELLLNEVKNGQKAFEKACKDEAAKLLGVKNVRVIWPDSGSWDKYHAIDEDEDTVKGRSSDITVSDITDDGDLDPDGIETLTIIKAKNPFVRGEFNDYGGGDDPHYYVPVMGKTST